MGNINIEESYNYDFFGTRGSSQFASRQPLQWPAESPSYPTMTRALYCNEKDPIIVGKDTYDN